MLGLISGLLVRDGENLRGKFSIKVLDNESIKKDEIVYSWFSGTHTLCHPDEGTWGSAI